MDSRPDWSLRLEENGLLVVDGRDGTIRYRGKNTAENRGLVKETYSVEDYDFQFLDGNEFLMPGLIDSHIHAPQFVNAGPIVSLNFNQLIKSMNFRPRIGETSFEMASAIHLPGRVEIL